MKQKHEPMFLEYDEDTQPMAPYEPPQQKVKQKAPSRRKAMGKFCAIICILGIVMITVPHVAEYLKGVNFGNFSLGAAKPSGCQIGLGSDRGSDMDVSVIIHGNRRNEATVDIIPPGQRRALPVDNQYHKRFIDTDELFIYQTYAWDTEWRPGSYTVVYDLWGQNSGRKTVQISGSGDHNIYVECN